MKILVIGDVMGKPGREILKEYLKVNKVNFDFIIVNGENAAAGFGLTEKIANEFFSWGVDIITSGNHIWDKRDCLELLDREDRILRPLNYPKGVPGHGYKIINKKGIDIAVINLQGRVFMPAIDCPFIGMDEALMEIDATIKIVDFHAEASSEKVALGHYLDGRVSAVYGTHTHIQTADNKILNDGTAYITDIGMTGGHDSVIGMKKESVIPKFLNCLPSRFEVSEDGIRINGIILDIDDITGKANLIDRIDISIDNINN